MGVAHHGLLELAQQQVQTAIAVVVHVDLVARIPEPLEGIAETRAGP